MIRHLKKPGGVEKFVEHFRLRKWPVMRESTGVARRRGIRRCRRGWGAARELSQLLAALSAEDD